MDAATQRDWDVWAQAHVRNGIDEYRDLQRQVLRGCFADIGKEIDQLRSEVTKMRDSPPLFAAPDKKLAAAMARVGEEMHAQKESIEALRASVSEYVKRSDLTGVRQRLSREISELAERGETTEKNVHGVASMVHSLGNAIECVHALVARLAVAVDAEHALNAGDKDKLPPEEQKTAAVLSLADLRQTA